jgi:hypothetical protein
MRFWRRERDSNHGDRPTTFALRAALRPSRSETEHRAAEGRDDVDHIAISKFVERQAKACGITLTGSSINSPGSISRGE